MNHNKYILTAILFLIGFIGFSQTSDHLLRGGDSSKDLPPKPIYSKDKTFDNRVIGGGSPKKTASKSSSSSSIDAGTTAGKFAVSLNGGATYTIPISSPAGVKNITPNVELSYNSQSGNGLAGWGWNISGVSSISRIPSTKYHDGLIDAVDFDEYDRFSLDGQRLLLKSGTYGANGAEYETENYSGLKITSHETSQFGANYGPSYFVVNYPDGSEAGFRTSSKLEWAITYKRDPQGNYIKYDYITSGGVLAINKIEYGGKKTTPHPNNISFTYKTRSRPELPWIGGFPFKRDKILDYITVNGATGLFRKYQLAHQISSLGYEKVASVQESNSENKSLAPITFSYESNGVAGSYLNTYNSNIFPGFNNFTDQVVSGEFNGDAKMDFILYNNLFKTQINIFNDIHNSSPNNTEIGQSYTVPHFDHVFGTKILNNDGKLLEQQALTFTKETLAGNLAPVTFKSYYTDTDGMYFQYEKTWNSNTYSSATTCNSSVRKIIPKAYISGDFNGDGLTDLIAIQKPYTQQYCTEIGDNCNGSGLGRLNEVSKDDLKMLERRPELGDGGGNCPCSCGTYSTWERTAYFIDLNKNITANFVNMAGALQEIIEPTDRVLTADFNGDGKTDIFHFKQGRVSIYGLSENNSLVHLHTQFDSFIDVAKPILLGDYNGDGKTDFVVPTYADTTVWRFFMANGGDSSSLFNVYAKDIYGYTYIENEVRSHFVYTNLDGTPTTTGYYENSYLEQRYGAQDLNGDGKTDLFRNTIGTSADDSHPLTKNVFMYKENLFLPNDIVPTFNHHYKVYDNLPISKFGFSILLEKNVKNTDLEYAYISNHNLQVYEFDTTHRKEMMFKSVSNNGVTHEVDYQELSTQNNNSGNNAYSGAYDEVYPFINLNNAPSIKLISQVTETGAGSTRKQDYRYQGAASHVTGLGFLGFQIFSKTNIYGNNVGTIWNTTKRDMQNRGAKSHEWTSLNYSNTFNNYINKKEYSYNTFLAPNKAYINKVDKIIIDDALLGTNKVKNFTYDQFFNPLSVSLIHSQGNVESTSYTYSNNIVSNTNTYHIGRVLQKINRKIFNGDLFTTTEQWTYNNNLIETLKRKGNNTNWLTETFSYDNWGNITSKNLTGAGSPRIEQYEYDPSGRFMTKSIDIEGTEANFTFDTNTGNPLTSTDAFGKTTEMEYNGWGRIIKSTNYLGKITTTTYSNTNISGYGMGVLESTNYDQGADTRVYFNALGQIVKEGQLSLNNQWIYKSYEYDAVGRKLKDSEPYFGASSPSQWNQYYFDQYGRPNSTQSYTGKVINTTYSGLTTTVDDGINMMTTTQDLMGNVISKQDPGGTINFTHYPNGAMKTSYYNGHLISVEIDGWGRKTKLTDPSAGVFTYSYNEIGELLEEVTPKGTTTYEYDNFGKILHKEVSGDLTALTLDYTYDNTTKLPTAINGQDTLLGKNYGYQYTYDTFQRPLTVKEITNEAEYEKQYNYDGYGRVENEAYITNNLSNGFTNTVKVKNNYDNAGILFEITDFNTNNSLWKIEEETAKGKAVKVLLGNGFVKNHTYDQFDYVNTITDSKIDANTGVSTYALRNLYSFNAQRGILNSRENVNLNWQENFGFDNLDRLTSISGSVNHTQTYDDRGRIDNNSHVGDYEYDSASKYKLSEIELNNQGDLYYQQHSLQQISYNAFKKPVEIFEENKGRVSFEYGPMMNRTNAYYGGLETNKTQRRFHKHYSSIIPVEIIEDTQGLGNTKIVTYIAGDAYSAPIVYIKQNGTVPLDEYHYVHRDHLGSITAITDSAGVVKEQRQFGAWGTVDKYVGTDTNFSHTSLLDRGFTGHEHFFEVSLLHMNGRMYDANLGRFLSPDNFVQDPYNTQSYNRYGYVWNNPLSNVDPSGEIVWATVIAGAIIGAIVGGATYAITASNSGQWNWGSFAISIVGGAVSGAIGGGLSPGSFPASMGVSWFAGTAASGIAVAVVSSFFSINVPIGDWNISVSPAIAFGNGFGAGMSFSAGYNDGKWGFSGGVGMMQYENYNGLGKNGTQIRKSILASYDDGKTGFSLGTNFWSGTGGMEEFDQQTGLLGFRSGDFNVMYENDGKPFSGISGDGNDQYRTAALSLSVGDYSVGFNLFTGKRTKGDYDIEELMPGGALGHSSDGAYGEHYKNGFVNETGPKHRLGALTLGYKGYRAGVNSEWIRHAIQNVAIHGTPIANQRMFEMQSSSWDGYFQYKTPNTYTTW